MKNNLLLFFVFIFSLFSTFSQNGTITGSVQDDKSNKTISEVKVLIQNLDMQSFSNSEGVFNFKNNVPAGKQILLFSKYGYENKSFEVIVPENGTVSIDKLKLKYKIQVSTINPESQSVPELSQLVDEPLKSLEKRNTAWRWRDWVVEPIGDKRWRLRPATNFHRNTED